MTTMLSLVTGAFNRPEAFRRLVDSIVKHTKVGWELVCSDASDVPLVCDDERVRILPERPRQGHCRGYNRAFREAKGPWLLWLNDDAEVCPGYDTEAIAFMEAHPQIGLGALHYSENGGPFHVNSAYGAIYANFGIFRKVIGEQVGFYDEDIEMYGADNAFALQILLAGYGIADIPSAKILHHSVNDQMRMNNQRNRANDNRTLTKKYMPLRARWLNTYNQHRILTDSTVWAHGVPATR